MFSKCLVKVAQIDCFVHFHRLFWSDLNIKHNNKKAPKLALSRSWGLRFRYRKYRQCYFEESFFAFVALARAGSVGVFFGGGPEGFTNLVNFLCLTFTVSITPFFFAISTFVVHAAPRVFLATTPKATQLIATNTKVIITYLFMFSALVYLNFLPLFILSFPLSVLHSSSNSEIIRISLHLHICIFAHLHIFPRSLISSL